MFLTARCNGLSVTIAVVMARAKLVAMDYTTGEGTVARAAQKLLHLWIA